MRSLPLVLLFSLGCAHETTFTSTPSGADVIIDGEKQGQTPLVWQQPYSDGDKRQVQVKGDAGAVSLETDESGFNTGLIVPMAVGCVAVPALLFPLGTTLGLVGAFAAGVESPLFPVAILTGNVIAFSGCFGAAFGVPATALAVFLVGRAGPDTVDVNLAAGTVRADPAARARTAPTPSPSNGSLTAQPY